MSQTSLGTCRWIHKAHSSTGIYSCSMRGNDIAKVEGQWPPSNWPNHSVPETQMTAAPRLLCTFLLYPIPRCMSRMIMTSLNDVSIICSPISVVRELYMHRWIAGTCLHLHWHPHWLFSSATQEPCHVFHNLNFESVTYICMYIYVTEWMILDWFYEESLVLVMLSRKTLQYLISMTS